MMKKNYHFSGLMLVDIIIINIAIMLSYIIRFDANIDPRYFDTYLSMILAVTIIKIIVLYLFGMYRRMWRYAGIKDLIFIMYAAIVANFVAVAYVCLVYPLLYGQPELMVPRSIYVISTILDIALLGGIRFLLRILGYFDIKLLLNNFSDAVNRKRVLVVGGGCAGSMIIKEIEYYKNHECVPVAIIDDDLKKKGKLINGVPVVGTSNDIKKIVPKMNIDEIIIAIPSADKKNFAQIIKQCRDCKVAVKILPDIHNLIEGKLNINQIRSVEIEDLLGRESISVDLNKYSNYLKGVDILITGGGGSIGSEICRQVAKFSPSKLYILDNYENSIYEIENELRSLYPKLKIIPVIASIRDEFRMMSIFEKYKPQIVFHTAAHKHVPLMENNPSEAIKNNIFGTLNVIKASDKYKVKRFVQISTDKAVNPTNVMGATKRFCELMIQAYAKTSKTEFVAVRFGNVLGSNGSVIPLFKKQIAKGGPITITHSDIIRYFMTIPEAVQLVIQAGGIAKGGEIFVLDMGQPVKIDKLARDLICLSGLTPDKDIKIVYSGLRPGEKLYEELLREEEGINSTKYDNIFVAKPMDITVTELDEKLAKLKPVIEEDREEIVEVLKDVIPTYKPKY